MLLPLSENKIRQTDRAKPTPKITILRYSLKIAFPRAISHEIRSNDDGLRVFHLAAVKIKLA